MEGLKRISDIMDSLRKELPHSIVSYTVEKVRDYKNNTVTCLKTGEVSGTGLPASNVMYYELNDNAWVCIRPSGTEPKLKIYAGVKGSSLEDALKLSEMLHKNIREMYIDKT